ncbi:PREDICTED: transmembrane protein 40 isoform X1 [Gavialis gangeticus]|uniref:transmembrane protein 40 isoform X1 n=1 Tax=Gavialis gangeticus TaxID=94835 RepID=UPI00092E842D|nr:PREDICTED: transmembrane protein 40 isoform X1 [Gavialis gangeticus]XP_019360563.1 PREDICTED: transmembrane protein 40 isoform X1 [Gavialis gangeticus]XP_019360564.1 PREDICTED: transmembrane protein 40 isoform X1 [Gavialis gangeticus]
MDSSDFALPVLTSEQQGIFQKAFTSDADYFETCEKINQPFWKSLIKCLGTIIPAILSTEETNNVLNRSKDSDPRTAALQAIEKKGANAMVVLYLLLKVNDPSGYRQLPSSKGNDEKLKLLERLEKSFMLSQQKRKAECSSKESKDRDSQADITDKANIAVATVKPLLHKESQEDHKKDAQHESDADQEDLETEKMETQLLAGVSTETVPYSEAEIARQEDAVADAYETHHDHCEQRSRWWMSIRKDDEFFHFVILCFAIGALLVCYHHYKDWTISLGIGLITFASLETTGIYFGLVHRIRRVLEGFIPLIQRFRPTGISKAD